MKDYRFGRRMGEFHPCPEYANPIEPPPARRFPWGLIACLVLWSLCAAVLVS